MIEIGIGNTRIGTIRIDHTSAATTRIVRIVSKTVNKIVSAIVDDIICAIVCKGLKSIR